MRVSASGSGVSASAIGSAEGGHRLVVDPTSETASAFRFSNRPGAVSESSVSFVAVRALSARPGAPMAASAPSDARTQGDRDSSAIRSTEDEAARSVRGGDMGVPGRRGAGSASFPPAMTASGRGLLPPHNHQLQVALSLLSVDHTHNEHISRFARRTEESDCDCLLAPHSSRMPCGRSTNAAPLTRGAKESDRDACSLGFAARPGAQMTFSTALQRKERFS